MKRLFALLLIVLAAGCGQSQAQVPVLQRFEALHGPMARLTSMSTSVSVTKRRLDTEISRGNTVVARGDAAGLRRLSTSLINSSSSLRIELRALNLKKANATQRHYFGDVAAIAGYDASEGRALAAEATLIWWDPWLADVHLEAKVRVLDRDARWYAWQAYRTALAAARWHREHRSAFRFVPVHAATSAPALGEFLPGFS